MTKMWSILVALSFVGGVVRAQAKADDQLDIRVIDVESIFKESTEMIVLKVKMKREEKQRKMNDKLKSLLEKLTDVTRQLDAPNILKEKKNELLKQRVSLINAYEALYKLKNGGVRIVGGGRSNGSERNEIKIKIYKRVFDEVKGLGFDLVIDKSGRGKSGSLFVVYSASNLDITRMIKDNLHGNTNDFWSKEAIHELGLPYPKLKIMTVDMNRLCDEFKKDGEKDKKAILESVTKRVKKYAVKEGIHLVLDSSAESVGYSQVLMPLRESNDITEILLR